MTLAEPMTLATDLVLGGVALALAWRLLTAAGSAGRRATRAWVVALAASGIAALVGGVSHGFQPYVSTLAAWILWRIVVWAVGVGSCAMLIAAFHACLAQPWRRRWIAVAYAQLAIYALWMLGHSGFIWVIADYAPAMLVVLGLHGSSYVRQRRAADGWIVAGVLVSLVAAAVQALGIAPHPRFNHNDLYHVIQIAALIGFYRGARLVRDRDHPETPPEEH